MFKLFVYLKPFSPAIFFILVLIFLQSLAELLLPTLMAEIVDVGIVNGDIAFIFKIGGLMLFIAGMGTVCSLVASYLAAKTASGFGKSLREKVFSRVENFSLMEIDQFGTATLITRSTNDITQVQQITVMMLRMMVSAPLLFVGGIIMAVSKNAELSRLFLFILPVMALIIFFIGRWALPLFRAIQSKLDKINLILRENLTGIRVIRAFNRVEHQKERYTVANRSLTESTLRVNRVMAAMMPLMMLGMNFTIILIIWFGSIKVDQGTMQVGDMMAFIQYALQIMYSLLMLSMMFVMIPRAEVSAVRINEVLNTKESLQIKQSSSAEEAGKEIKQGLIEFEDVTFYYPGAETPAVSNITFTANPGETVAFIGGTGSGKSTILKLLLRFYDPQSGKVKLAGTDIKDLSLSDLREKIGYVPQKNVLFTGTIEENIKLGKQDASPQEVSKAADIAQATEFIEEHEDKFESVIAQSGKNLSGGQKQRLAIARALIKKPLIYAFDDSFSALDYKTDAKLRTALYKEVGNATVLIVAQRVNAVRTADRIIVLDQGRIVGCGKHSDLLKTCTVYREIAASQLSEEELG